MPREGRGGGAEDGRGRNRGRGQSIGEHTENAFGGRKYQGRTGPKDESGLRGGTEKCIEYKEKR